eukprot:9464983-Ditylum_brightwellii.AAC.1
MKDARVLKDPNEFIGDIIAISNTTKLRYDFNNVRNTSRKDNIPDAFGDDITGSVVGDLKGTLCDKNGQECNVSKGIY